MSIYLRGKNTLAAKAFHSLMKSTYSGKQINKFKIIYSYSPPSQVIKIKEKFIS